jgi:hypothetical protein
LSAYAMSNNQKANNNFPSKEDMIQFLNTQKKYLNMTFIEICYEALLIFSKGNRRIPKHALYLMFNLLYSNQVSSAKEAYGRINRGEIV